MVDTDLTGTVEEFKKAANVMAMGTITTEIISIYDLHNGFEYLKERILSALDINPVLRKNATVQIKVLESPGKLTCEFSVVQEEKDVTNQNSTP